MKKSIFLILTALILVFILITGAFCSSADAGDFGGDFDFGDSDSGGFDFGSDYDSDYGDSDGFYILPSSGSTIVIIIVVIIIIIFIKNKNGSGKTGTGVNLPRPAATARTDQSSLMPLSSLVEQDPRFSESEIREKVSNLYVQLQNAWTAKNLEVIRPYTSDALYAQLDRQLESYRINRTTNRVERISVLGCDIRGWKQDNENDVLIIALRTRITDYVVRDSDGQIVRGSASAEKFMEYEWELIRTKGVKTGDREATVVKNCPKCGAPLNINHTAKCEYCDSIITVNEHDWVLNSMKGISQQTLGG